MKRSLDLLGSAGAVAAAAGTPCCFPLLGVVGAALGLGFLEPYSGTLMVLFQVMVALAAVGAAVAYQRHRNRALLVLGMASAAATLAGYYTRPNPILLYAGMVGLVAGALWSFRESRRCATGCEVDA